ncbi:hypothetical protein Vadar_031922 [Vaccinium darrowii]|uniref:Uncharacterized protein n=1 Tax=Vaccinium darrowii TaxID=229202 RepID=A0ACB7Y395_9ERIC|nr:hypothetical protein Vadar_031922 [Vaccinium darrowii]
MAEAQDQFEIKFRLTDGSDIGPNSFPAAASVATLKESILSQWPKDKENGPRTVKDVKIISAGKILENSRTLGEHHLQIKGRNCQRDESRTSVDAVYYKILLEGLDKNHLKIGKRYNSWRRRSNC